MKAAVLKNVSELSVTEIPGPRAGRGEMVVRVRACAICGTDIKVYYHGHKHIRFPRITGHEVSGVIDQIGDSVSGFSTGQAVAVAPAIPCGRCPYCRKGIQSMCDNLRAIGYHYDGGFAEFLLVPEDAVRNGCVNTFPEDISFEEAALAEPLACVINGQELSRVGLGDTVVILGAGPIGCMHAEVARVLGADRVFLADISGERLRAAAFTGATPVDLSAGDIRSLLAGSTDGRMADRVIVAVGSHQAQELALELVSKRGSVNYFGGLPREKPTISFNSNLLHYGEFYVVGTHGSAPRHNQTALGLLASRRIDARRYISARIPLDEIREGYRLAEERRGLKIVVTP